MKNEKDEDQLRRYFESRSSASISKMRTATGAYANLSLERRWKRFLGYTKGGIHPETAYNSSYCPEPESQEPEPCASPPVLSIPAGFLRAGEHLSLTYYPPEPVKQEPAPAGPEASAPLAPPSLSPALDWLAERGIQAGSELAAVQYLYGEREDCRKRLSGMDTSSMAGPGIIALNERTAHELEMAWGIIANASAGDWSKQNEDWVQAAAAWEKRVMPSVGEFKARASKAPPGAVPDNANEKETIKRWWDAIRLGKLTDLGAWNMARKWNTPGAQGTGSVRYHLDAVEAAWGIIANASEGDWTKQTAEWTACAERWRDQYCPGLAWHQQNRTTAEPAPASPEPGAGPEPAPYIMPLAKHRDLRIARIDEAMTKCLQTGHPIPHDWLAEIEQLEADRSRESVRDRENELYRDDMERHQRRRQIVNQHNADAVSK